MRIGYVGISKSANSQALDIKYDTLVNAGVLPKYIYDDKASGKKDNRQGLTNCIYIGPNGELRDFGKLVLSLLDAVKNRSMHMP